KVRPSRPTKVTMATERCTMVFMGRLGVEPGYVSTLVLLRRPLISCACRRDAGRLLTKSPRMRSFVSCFRQSPEYDRYQQTTPPQLSPADRALLQEMATDVPRLWHAEGTTVEDRKDLIR